MMSHSDATKLPWCVVVADPADGLLVSDRDPRLAPVQYHSPDAGAPLLQRALNRGTSITTASRVLLTALEECRQYWESPAWFVKPANRFVCDHRAALQLASAAAILSVAAVSPSEIVVMMPARCYVAHEWILKSALQYGLAELPLTWEGIIMLGMRDIEENDDEDYLVVSRSNANRRLQVDAFVRRPVPWVASHLKREGALVASGVLIGYAGAFASYISKMWPGLAIQLAALTSAAALVATECDVPVDIALGVPSVQSHALRWQPPSLPLRVLAVSRSGWNGLKSPRAVSRLTDFCGRHNPIQGSQYRRSSALRSHSATGRNHRSENCPVVPSTLQPLFPRTA